MYSYYSTIYGVLLILVLSLISANVIFHGKGLNPGQAINVIPGTHVSVICQTTDDSKMFTMKLNEQNFLLNFEGNYRCLKSLAVKDCEVQVEEAKKGSSGKILSAGFYIMDKNTAITLTCLWKELNIYQKEGKKADVVEISISGRQDIFSPDNSIHLNCLAKGGWIPTYNYRWYYNNNSIANANTSEYHIDRVSLQSNGRYRCDATNTNGTTSGFVDINVAFLKVIKSENVESLLHAPVSIQCTAEYFPQISEWYFLHYSTKYDAYSPTLNIKSGSSHPEGTKNGFVQTFYLQLEHVAADDFGFYKCVFIVNSNRVESDPIELVEIRDIGTPLNFKLKHISGKEVSLEWKANYDGGTFSYFKVSIKHLHTKELITMDVPLEEEELYSIFLDSLQWSSNYSFYIHECNEVHQCGKSTSSITFTTPAEISDTVSIAGTTFYVVLVLLLIVIFFILVSVVFIWRGRNKKKRKNKQRRKQQVVDLKPESKSFQPVSSFEYLPKASGLENNSVLSDTFVIDQQVSPGIACQTSLPDLMHSTPLSISMPPSFFKHKSSSSDLKYHRLSQNPPNKLTSEEDEEVSQSDSNTFTSDSDEMNRTIIAS